MLDRVKEIQEYIRARRCVHRGRVRPDIPHAGGCCVPVECAHPETPETVTARQCGTCRHRQEGYQ